MARAAGLLTPRERGWAARALGAAPLPQPSPWRALIEAVSMAAARGRRSAS